MAMLAAFAFDFAGAQLEIECVLDQQQLIPHGCAER